MLYDDSFKGKQTFREYLIHIRSKIPELKFIVDDTNEYDPNKVGVMWHVECEGRLFPLSRGASYYVINDQGLLQYGRDVVELPIKTGASLFPVNKTL